MICVLEFIGAVAAMIAGFIIWALLIEWRTNSNMRAFSARWDKLSEREQEEEINRMRAFSARWDKLSEREQEEEINRVRAAREMLEIKRHAREH